MSHLTPIAEFESLEEVFDDIVPTQRRPQGKGAQRSTLTPPPERTRPGESRHVDLKAIMSEPPSARDEASETSPFIPPPPRMPNMEVPDADAQRVVVHPSDDWTSDQTPPPLAADVGSVAPLALSSPPPSASSEPPVHTGWKLATAALAATLAVGIIAVFAPLDRIGSTQSLAAAVAVAEPPPHISVSDLPVVGYVEARKPEPVTVSEVNIFAYLPTREKRSPPPASLTDDLVGEEASELELGASTTEMEEPEPPKTLPPFDRSAAASALGAAAASASSCRQPGTPAGWVRVAVTIAPSGRVTTATISGAFAGTPVGGCIAKTFRTVRIEPFEGNLVTVHKSVAIR